MKKNKAVAIITARGGSKRIPRKNIKLFLDYPIIKYSIEAAIASNCFEEVMVSTDDQEIAEIAKKYGANVPFVRSVQMSNDYAPTADVIQEVLNEYEKRNMVFDFFCCIYPTAPFITAKKLREAIQLLKDKEADSVVPVVRFGYPIQRAFKIVDNQLQMICPENLNMRSQDLMPAYHDAGQFYVMKTASFNEQKKLFARNTAPLIVPETEVQDIDTLEDWHIAEMKYKILIEKYGK
jgi:pseudaminic acid cytidylyltransferase